MDGGQARIAKPTRRRLIWTSLMGLAALWSAVDAPVVRGQSSPEAQATETLPVRAPSARRAGATDATLEEILQRRGSVSFRNTPLSAVVFSLSEVWGVNIVAGSGVTGEVSGVFENAPLVEVLDAVLGANGFAYRRSGQSLVILPVEQVGIDDPTLRSRTLKVPMAAGDMDGALRAAAMLLGSRGQMQAIPSSGSVLVVDTEERIDRIAAFFESLERSRTIPLGIPGEPMHGMPHHAPLPPPQISYFTPQFVSAKTLEVALADALGPAAVLSILEDENRLMVIGSPEQVALASQVVTSLDTPRPQVRITALIYDVELRRGEELGIDWGRTLTIDGRFGGSPVTGGTGGGTGGTGGGTGAHDAASAAAAGFAITLGTLEDTLSLGSVIKALDETRGAHLLADPTITVVDRSEASIKIVTKIPYQQLTQTQQGGNIGTTAFEEAGITLTVTPRIARDGTIQMKVRPEFSTLIEFVDGQPLIDSRAAETDVRVSDCHTLVIGGLRRKQMGDAVTGIPGLFKLKYVGRLFGAHASTETESELLVFLRPEIITPYEQLRPREVKAACVGMVHLDGVPVADHRPMIPDCNDPHCVYHNPRPNVNSGGPSTRFVDPMGISMGDLEMIGGAGMEAVIPPARAIELYLGEPEPLPFPAPESLPPMVTPAQ